MGMLVSVTATSGASRTPECTPGIRSLVQNKAQAPLEMITSLDKVEADEERLRLILQVESSGYVNGRGMEHDNQDPKGSLDTMNGDQDTPKDEERQNSSGDATKDSSGPSKSALANAQSLVDRGLEFLANASNGTLGACLVGLGATTYLVLGRFGLLLIGVVGGVALHAAWEVPAARAGDRAIKTRGNERGLDIVERLLICREHQKAEESEEDDDADANTSATTVGKRVMDYSAFSPSTSAALTELTDALIRNYVE
ncbi:MAG: hypothetical protein M1819_001029 [Sarea resinae]|nr:MAG: hypothetical protein M1819_001029 [Sarea resinae]